jgi:hypothetical protein
MWGMKCRQWSNRIIPTYRVQAMNNNDLRNTLIKPPYATNVFRALFIVHYLQYVSAPIGDHLQVKCTQKYI